MNERDQYGKKTDVKRRALQLRSFEMEFQIRGEDVGSLVPAFLATGLAGEGQRLETSLLSIITFAPMILLISSIAISSLFYYSLNMT